MSTNVEMDLLLKSVLNKYNRLLKYYEAIYDKFKEADYTKMEEYIKIINESSSYLQLISKCQKEIEDCRDSLRGCIHNDILIDSVIGAYSDGKISSIIERIEFITRSLRLFEEKARATLKREMDEIQSSLEEVGIDEEYVKLFTDLAAAADKENKTE